MANPGRPATPTSGAATPRLPDFVSSPGQAKLFAAFLADYLDTMRQRAGEHPTRFDQIHQDLVSVGAKQLGELHEQAG